MAIDALRIARLAVIPAIAALACTRSVKPEREVPIPVGPTATIEGVVDAADGTFVIRSLGAELGGSSLAGLTELPVVQDGRPGVGPPDTLELVTERAQTVAGACAPDDAFEGDVRVRSFYPGYTLRNVYIEILSITPTGREACNSASPVPADVSAQYGLFAYADLAEAGQPGDSAVATWRFRLPDATRFVFTGRVMADLVDERAPTTAAVPPGGLSREAPSVVLTCSDAGSGCAATYYTTDGSEPTPSSTRYTAPIVVASSTTLRFFSVDLAGNAEAPRSETYVIDGVAPEVVSVDPHDLQGDVPGSAVVTLTFSEPMDAATVPGAISLGGPGGPIAGSVTQSGSTSWVFRPAVPLPQATTFQVQVTAAALDLAGNALVPFSSRFSTATPVGTVSGLGSATYRSLGTAFDAAGNGVAVFTASSTAASFAGVGGALLFSYYDAATGAWGPEQPLQADAAVGWYLQPAKVVSNGTSFLVVWRDPASEIYAALIAGGIAGPVRDLGRAVDYWPGALDAATCGGGYAVAITYSGLQVWMHDGTTWDPLGPTQMTPSLYAKDPALACAGSTYVAAYHEHNYGTNHAIYTARYDRAARSWTTAQLPGTFGTAYILPPAIASNGTKVIVGWGTTTGPVMASTDSGAGFGAAVNVSNGWGDRPYELSAAANGARFALAWFDLPASGQASAYGAVFDGTAWTGSSQLAYVSQSGPAVRAVVAPSGTGFVAGVALNDSPSSSVPSSLWINRTTSGGYWSSSSRIALESRASDAAELGVSRRGADAVFSWAQEDGARHQVKAVRFDGTSLGATTGIVAPGRPASSDAVRLASNAAGEIAAVWVQDDMGERAVFAALRSGGTWRAPVRVALSASAPAVASNGAGFMIAYAGALRNGSTGGVRAVPFTNGVLGASTLLEGGNAIAPSIASDGSGYLVAWRLGGGGTRAAIFSGGAWGPAATVNNYKSGTGAYNPVAAGHAGEYLVVWRDRSTGYQIVTRRATAPAPGGPWTWDADSAVVGWADSAADTYAVAATQSEFAVVSREAGTAVLYAAVQRNGAWQPRVTLVTSPPYCNQVGMGASSDGFLAVASCSGLRILRYRDGAWEEQTTSVGARAERLAVSSNGQDYKVLALQTDGAGYGIFAIDVAAAGQWWPARRVVSGQEWPLRILPLAAVFDGTEHVAAWIQRTADPALEVVRSRASY